MAAALKPKFAPSSMKPCGRKRGSGSGPSSPLLAAASVVWICKSSGIQRLSSRQTSIDHSRHQCRVGAHKAAERSGCIAVARLPGRRNALPHGNQLGRIVGRDRSFASGQAQGGASRRAGYIAPAALRQAHPGFRSRSRFALCGNARPGEGCRQDNFIRRRPNRCHCHAARFQRRNPGYGTLSGRWRAGDRSMGRTCECPIAPCHLAVAKRYPFRPWAHHF